MLISLKLAPLLAQYLYIHKRLDLPGLGSFLLDPSTIIEQENSRQSKLLPIEGVSFDYNPSLKESPELIQFISSQTGKIKALAAADLDSHLGLAQQFINIGKPFLFEGIGSLSKIKSGEFNFTPGLLLTEKFVDQQIKEVANSSTTEEQATDYKSVFYAPKTKTRWVKPAMLLLILIGIGLAIWGGYTIYKRTAANEEASTTPTNKTETTDNTITIITDSVVAPKKDSITASTQIITSGSTKFVLETGNAARAFSRFAKLKTFQWNVQMETKDSVTYKIFMLLPVSAADTTRVADSLKRLTGKRVYIEN